MGQLALRSQAVKMKTIVLVLSMIFISNVAQERNCEYGEYFVPKQCENMKSNNDCFDHYYDFYREIRMQSGNFRCSKAIFDCVCDRIGKSHLFRLETLGNQPLIDPLVVNDFIIEI